MSTTRAISHPHLTEVSEVDPTSEALFRTLADHAPTMLWLTDADGGIIYFNKRWLDFTGLTREAVFGAGWVQCLHPDDRERCLTFGLEQVGLRRPFQMEYRLRQHTGR
jgi:PAS domain S-box-containing protein